MANFTDSSPERATAALELATDLGFLRATADGFQCSNPLCRFFRTTILDQRATALRIMLDQYEPFALFLRRLQETGQPSNAAKDTKVLLDLDAHHEEIKDTLISLGTYAQVLIAEGAGKYRAADDPAENRLVSMATRCSTETAARTYIADHVGRANIAKISEAEVYQRLAIALVRAGDSDPAGAVTEAGNAVESFLSELAARASVSLGGANGLNAKAEEIAKKSNAIPKKLLGVSKYLGHIRNAADHGVDSEVGKSWGISQATGTHYVFVACSFIRSCIEWEERAIAEL